MSTLFSFPTSPSLDQTYTFGGKTWKYNGTGWALVTNVDIAQSAWNTANLAYYISNEADTIAKSAYDSSNTKFNSSGGSIFGNTAIYGNLSVTGNISYTGNVTSTTITGNTGQFFGYSSNGFNALYAGIPTGYLIDPQLISQFTANYNGYAGVNQQNINSGTLSSVDAFFTPDNGSLQDTFLDLGMASSTYNYPGYTMIAQNDGYLIAYGNTITGGGNMIVSTGLNNDIIFTTGGVNVENEMARFKNGTGLVLKNLPITFADNTSQNTAAAPYAYSNSAYAFANSINTYAYSAYSSANSTLTYATAAFNLANTGNVLAQAAYNQANLANVLAQAAFNKANAANVLAQSSYDYGNTVNTYAFSAYSYANGTNTLTVSAYNKANAANVLAQASFDFANTVNAYSSSAYAFANSVNTYASAAYANGNNTLQYTQSAYAFANSVNTYAFSAYANGNNTLQYAQSGYNKANGANVIAQASFDFANTVNTYASSAYANGNNTLLFAQAGFNKANGANVIAQAAFDFANSVNTYAFAAYANGNNTLQYAQAAYGFANTVNTYAYSAYANGNNTLQFAQAGFNLANTANVTAQAAFNKANAAVQTGFTTISANGTSITPSSNADTFTITAASSNGINILNPSSKTIDFGLRTSGVTAGNYGSSTNIPVIAVDAFGRITSASNSSISTSISLSGTSGTGSVSGGGTLTFSGTYGVTASASGSTITIATPQDLQSTASPSFNNLSVTGNLSVAGTYTYANTQIFQTYDSLIELAANNTTDVVDIGFYGQYSSSNYAGLVRTAGSNFVLFKGVSAPTSNAFGSITLANYGTLRANLTGGMVSGLANTIGISDGGTNNSTYTSGALLQYNGTGIVSLANTGVTAGSYGNTSTIPSITIDAYGRITSVSNTAVSVAGSNIITNVDKFTGTGSQTSFALSATPFNINNTLINIDGVTQQKSTYSVSGNNIVFSTPPLTGNSIEVSYSYNLPPSNLTGVVTNVDTFISNGSTTVFTLSSTPVSSNNVTVNINGAVQQKSTYSVSGVSIILTESPASGAKIEVSYFYNTTIAFVSSTPTLNSLSLAYSTQVNTIAYANTAGKNNLIDTFSTYAFRTAMYDVQVTNGSGYQSSKLMVVQSDSDAIVSEYSTVSTYLSSLGSFTANVVFNATLNTNVAQLYFNPNYSGNSTVIINRTTIANTGISSTLTLGQTYDLNTISLSTIDLNTYVNEPIDLAF